MRKEERGCRKDMPFFNILHFKTIFSLFFIMAKNVIIFHLSQIVSP